MRRLIQIQDGNTEAVEIWLAFLRKHAYYGVGMKANVWEYEKIGLSPNSTESVISSFANHDYRGRESHGRQS